MSEGEFESISEGYLEEDLESGDEKYYNNVKSDQNGNLGSKSNFVISDEESSDGRSSTVSYDDGLSSMPLSLLTQEQLETLLERKEKELKQCKIKLAKFRIRKEAMEVKKHKTIHEEQMFQEIIKLLKEEEVYLHNLLKRIELIKKLQQDDGKCKPGSTFEASKIPQVILCSTWDDTKVPKVVVCSTPRIGRMERLTTEFLKVLSPEQLAIIEKEKQWMAIECGKVRLQIAGIKGKIKVITKENEILRTIIDTTDRHPEDIHVIMPDDVGHHEQPCFGTKGIPGKAKPCTKLTPNKSQKLVHMPPIEFQLEASPAYKRHTLTEELQNIEKTIRQLQEDLDLAIANKVDIGEKKEQLLGLGKSLARLNSFATTVSNHY